MTLRGPERLRLSKKNFFLQKVEAAIQTERKVNADYQQQSQSSNVEICDYEEEQLAAWAQMTTEFRFSGCYIQTQKEGTG